MCICCGEVGKFLFFWLIESISSFSLSGRSSYIESSFPRPEDFSKALYTLDIGQNDLHGGFVSMTEKQVLASIPNIINQSAEAVKVTKIYVLYSFLTTYILVRDQVVSYKVGTIYLLLNHLGYVMAKCTLQPVWSMLWRLKLTILILNFLL